jgi:hypothetical protein
MEQIQRVESSPRHHDVVKLAGIPQYLHKDINDVPSHCGGACNIAAGKDGAEFKNIYCGWVIAMIADIVRVGGTRLTALRAGCVKSHAAISDNLSQQRIDKGGKRFAL